MNDTQRVQEICDVMGLACQPSPGGSWAKWLDAFQGMPFSRSCPDCGKAMKERGGKYGKFLGCSGYPKCKHTENV